MFMYMYFDYEGEYRVGKVIWIRIIIENIIFVICLRDDIYYKELVIFLGIILVFLNEIIK